MEPQQSLPPMDDSEDPSSTWDFSYLLDFNLDEDHTDNSLPFSSLFNDAPEIPNDRVRKRDPRLTCSNFLAGRVPCACPELDAKLEDEGLPGKKRARTARASSSARCQVPGCEVDISELKGYHRRHRVCLLCANATTVVLHGEPKRYCQQCGKFHVLSDFDEGKRSCRRKLERHNTRRRRKPLVESGGGAIAELEAVTQNEENNYDAVAGKDCSNLSNEINDIVVLPDHGEEPVPILVSAPDAQNVNSDSVVSLPVSGETRVNSGNTSNSPSYCDNKSAYTSMCQTGRISFKLYDWNPAEFPRRLRHQIFQWLASMPVELEGYIRPGCTILTSFIAMPNIMWINLRKESLEHVNKLVAPGNMLSGRGTALVHLNDIVFRVMKDGTSVTKVEVSLQAPRLHYVHPTCFEAGKPMEFVACGSNLLQPKFQLLVSFSGKYLKCEYCVPSPHNWTEENISCAFDNQLYKIYVPHTEESLSGPAFIEVENESGLSNFIPVLIADKETCSEMKILQQKLDSSLLSNQFRSASGGSICSSCETFTLSHTSSDLLVDIAWLLKDTTSENFDRVITASQIQRYCHLLDFLMCNESTVMLEKILPNLIILTASMKSNFVINTTSDVDTRQLLNHIHNAQITIFQKHQKNGSIIVQPEMEGFRLAQGCSHDNKISVAINSQGILSRADAKWGVLKNLTCSDKNERIPLLKRDIIMNVEELPEIYGRGCLGRGLLTPRPAIFVMVSIAVCLGVCVAVLHPGGVTELAVSVRRCLFNY
ncbi:Squamosa promoter-binding-like protein [Vigna angularis]|uniref:Squamosa promoter-binding-like protein n=2 Tax=Phaseolus angularis TaxID=3914 RepID=A0A8T0K973_PHAAN|nr:squamosa promoter-binding-like protein 7 [Vigna angularis]KAG2395799.1 Squamosa promoter-binding-like protein [Vigna angularis]